MRQALQRSSVAVKHRSAVGPESNAGGLDDPVPPYDATDRRQGRADVSDRGHSGGHGATTF
jgi:hypothetical protein